MVGAGGAVAQIEGTLEATTLSSLLSTLAQEQRTGLLRIDGGSEVWLCLGRTCLALTPSTPDLSTVLFDSDVASADAIAAALSDGSPLPFRPDRPSALDQLLHQRPESVGPTERLVHELSLNALFELLVPSDAAYRFEPDVMHPIGVRFAQDTFELVANARRRLEIWRRIAARIPSTGAVFQLAPALPGGERLVSADEWRFLSRLDGRRTVAELIADTGESAFRVCSSLYRLLLEEVILEAA
jgi:Domain of unknown function (DUF4388)